MAFLAQQVAKVIPTFNLPHLSPIMVIVLLLMAPVFFAFITNIVNKVKNN